MSLVAPLVLDNGAARAVINGDTIATNDRVDASNTTAGASTWSANQALAPVFWRTGPGGAYNETTPDAQTWLNAILQNTYLGAGATTPLGVPVGFAYRMRFVNTVAFIATVVAGANVTLAGTTAVAASTFRDFLVTVLNGTPTQIFAATTTNASAVVTGMSAAQTAQLSVGQAVSGTGIAGGTTVISVQPGVGVTLSANATASNVLVALTFAPRIELRGIGSGPI